MKPPPGLFITGTDTGVGKTYVAAVIARSLVGAGCHLGVYKPVLSGYGLDISTGLSPEPGDQPDDDVVLWRAAGSPGEILRVCPQRFRAPIAPHLAARSEGREINTDQLRSGIEYWRERSDFVLVEGAGGLMSPVSDDQYIADVALELGYPLVVVAANKLGAINQTLQTLMTAAAFRKGLAVAAVVLNDRQSLDSNADQSRLTNFHELQLRSKMPVFAMAYQSEQFEPRMNWLDIIERARVPDF